jgi:hypothetical protein
MSTRRAPRSTTLSTPPGPACTDSARVLARAAGGAADAFRHAAECVPCRLVLAGGLAAMIDASADRRHR